MAGSPIRRARMPCSKRCIEIGLKQLSSAAAYPPQQQAAAAAAAVLHHPRGHRVQYLGRLRDEARRDCENVGTGMITRREWEILRHFLLLCVRWRRPGVYDKRRKRVNVCFCTPLFFSKHECIPPPHIPKKTGNIWCRYIVCRPVVRGFSVFAETAVKSYISDKLVR